eukprot:1192541-Prorocentrum_minimum.AAC.3
MVLADRRGPLDHRRRGAGRGRYLLRLFPVRHQAGGHAVQWGAPHVARQRRPRRARRPARSGQPPPGNAVPRRAHRRARGGRRARVLLRAGRGVGRDYWQRPAGAAAG